MRKYRKRRFVPGECMHVYQRSVNGFNLFYDVEDFIVFYTIVSVLSKVYDVSVLEMCMMIDHFHLLTSSASVDDLSAFVRHSSSVFALEFNYDVGRTGPLFHKSFGSAPKKGGKKIRSTIVYIGNNPVEKKLCDRAEDYRWNFLKYINDDTPFSDKVKSPSAELKRAKSEVRYMAECNRYLTYAQVRRLLYGLKDDERKVLIDYIICKYFFFDTDYLLSYYEDCDEMLSAMKSTSGSEHDIKEKYYSGSDCIYRDMYNLVKRDFQIFPVKQVIVLPAEQKLIIARYIKQSLTASHAQISKFLHIDFIGEGNELR